MLKTIIFLVMAVAVIHEPSLRAQSTKAAKARNVPKPYVASPKAVAAVSALKKLKAKVEIGVTHTEYRSALGDVQFAVNDYLEDSVSTSTPLLDSKLRDALRAYTLAESFWKAAVDNNNDPFLPCAEAGKELCATYPEGVEKLMGTGWPVIFISVYRQASWQSASAKVSDASELVVKGESSVSTQPQAQEIAKQEDEEIRTIAQAINKELKDAQKP